MDKLLIAPASRVTPAMRSKRNRHLGGVLWFTGLSGAGKSTLGVALEQALFEKGWQVTLLDGDALRKGLCTDLGFSPESRRENIRRAAHVARLMADAGLLVIASFITPTEEDRAVAAENVGGYYRGVFIKASLEVCELRDVKGLYAKARSGEIPEFTGVSAPYEAPPSADLVIESGTESVEACLVRLIAYTEAAFTIP